MYLDKDKKNSKSENFARHSGLHVPSEKSKKKTIFPKFFEKERDISSRLFKCLGISGQVGGQTGKDSLRTLLGRPCIFLFELFAVIFLARLATAVYGTRAIAMLPSSGEKEEVR